LFGSEWRQQLKHFIVIVDRKRKKPT